MSNNCPNCECHDCEQARDDIAEAAETKAKMESWNLNFSPREVADEIEEMTDGGQYGTDRWLDAIEKFFGKDTREQVIDASLNLC